MPCARRMPGAQGAMGIRSPGTPGLVSQLRAGHMQQGELQEFAAGQDRCLWVLDVFCKKNRSCGHGVLAGSKSKPFRQRHKVFLLTCAPGP